MGYRFSRARGWAVATCLVVTVLTGGENVSTAYATPQEEVLRDPDYRVRVSAAISLGRSRAPGARVALERALADGHPAVRIAAAASLEQLGDTAAAKALEQRASQEPMMGVKQKMLESAETLRSAQAEGTRPTLRGAKVVLGLGMMRNLTPVANERASEIMRSAAKKNLAGKGSGTVVIDASDGTLVKEAHGRHIPVLVLDGQLSHMTQNTQGSNLTISAQVEFSVRQLPQQTLRGTLSGGASAQGSSSALGNQARLAELQNQVIGGAVEGALRRADHNTLSSMAAH